MPTGMASLRQTFDMHGPTHYGVSGQLLELVAVPTDVPARIIHADGLRAKFYEYLR